MSNKQWRGHKKSHEWEFNGIFEGIEFHTCAYCDAMEMWNGNEKRLMTKEEIKQYNHLIENEYGEFSW